MGAKRALESFLYSTCGECMVAKFVDKGWVVCGHPRHEGDEQTLHDGWHQDAPIPTTCPLRERRALLGLKEGA